MKDDPLQKTGFVEASSIYMHINEKDFKMPPSLEEFARTYKMQAEICVAAETLSRFNDKFYGQWLMLHVPFESRTEFLDKAVDDLVPRSHRYMGMFLQCKHPVAKLIQQRERMQDEMQKEGHGMKHRQQSKQATRMLQPRLVQR